MKPIYVALLIASLLLPFMVSCKTLPSSINLAKKADSIISFAKISPPDTGNIIITAKTLYKDDEYVKYLEDQLTEFQAESAQSLQFLFETFLAASAIMLVAGVLLLSYNQQTLGAGLIAGSVALAAFTFMAIEYMWLVGIVAATIVILFLCYLACKLYHTRTALVDTVKTVELSKQHDWDSIRKSVSQVQSPQSKQLIRLIKDKEVNK